jgi:hypothetical protein
MIKFFLYKSVLAWALIVSYACFLISVAEEKKQETETSPDINSVVPVFIQSPKPSSSSMMEIDEQFLAIPGPHKFIW